MFSLHNFVLSAVTGMAGYYPDWQVREYALGWYNKAVLTEEDLSKIEEQINPQKPEATEEAVTNSEAEVPAESEEVE